MAHLPYFLILKTKVNILDMQTAVNFLTGDLSDLSGQYVCVSNVHTTVMSYRNPEYRAVQNGSALNLPDGKPLSLVQKARGYTNAERVPGPDLMTRLFAVSEEKGYTHFFYGSKPETLDALRKKLQELSL